MAQAQPFLPVQLVCGLIAAREEAFARAEKRLSDAFGPVLERSPRAAFDSTDYYEKEMGEGRLERYFLAFDRPIDPTELPAIKLRTNALEEEVRAEFGAARRVVNCDPGYLTPAALVMATAKDFSHRIPLGGGIYAHLEFLFARNGVRFLDWTYPDFRKGAYTDFFLKVRGVLLARRRGERRSSG